MPYVFDVLHIDGTSTTDLPYLERREALANLSLEHPRIKVPPHWLNVDGPTMLEVARKHHLEGIVAKSITSTYQLGKRSPRWLKTPLRANTEGIVCGFVPGSGNAAGGIGSLILGAHDDSGSLVYIGNVGTGFSSRQRRELREQLVDIEDPPARSRPRQCGVREYTGGGLRHPAFKGMRIDESVIDVDLPGRHRTGADSTGMSM